MPCRGHSGLYHCSNSIWPSGMTYARVVAKGRPAVCEISAGAEYAHVTRVSGFRRNVLEIEVKGAIPMQELSQFHKRKVLEKLRKALAGVTIADLRFRAAAW